jgi:hypothetical protein
MLNENSNMENCLYVSPSLRYGPYTPYTFFVNAPIGLRRCPVTGSPMVDYASRIRPPDSTNCQAMIRRMRHEWGWTWRQIGCLLGRSPRSLYGRYERKRQKND